MNSIRPDIPDEFQRVVTRCLKKDPEQRYASARLLMDDLRRIRRDTEAGRPLAGPWQQKALDLWQELRHLPRSRHLWYAAGLAVLVIAAGVFLWRMRLENFLLYAVVILVAYRFMRNRPQHAQAELAKRLSKIPEVRLVVFREHHADVVVDCPVPQLYLQINEHLRSCNQSLFFGAPMTLTILYDVPPGQMQSMLSGPGVQYVRRDVLEKTPAVPPRT